MEAWTSALAVLAALALAVGAVPAWARGDRRRGGLMLVAALVLVGNVAIWTWP